jgi:trehalose/maltose hydrolase-like predicted phosphorylase
MTLAADTPDDPRIDVMERTVEAIIFDWDAVTGPGEATADEIWVRLDALCAAGVHVFVMSETDLGSVTRQVHVRPIRSGALNLLPWAEFEWALAWLAERGVTGSLVLVVCDEPIAESDSRLYWLPPSGPESFVAVLDTQLAGRRDHRVPDVDLDPEWVVALPDAPAMERAAAAIGTLANGSAAIRGTREEDGPASTAMFAVSGVYTGSDELLAGPMWTDLTVRRGVPDRRILDLHCGLLMRTSDTGLRTIRFVSAARPKALALRGEAPSSDLEVGATIGPSDRVQLATQAGAQLARTVDAAGASIVVAARNRDHVTGGRRVVERLAGWVAEPSRPPGWEEAADVLTELEGVGFDRLLAEHREAWARWWQDATVDIEGDADSQLAARFAVFHLLGAARDQGEAAVGARGLTGSAYGGHVFWDADVFVLPVLAAVRPQAARAMLEYRLRRLPAARAAAAAQRLRGARFPWESAGDGSDVTPRGARGRRGELIPIRTGEREEHIVADVAWAACEYVAWSGDTEFLSGPGADLVLDTARYWASRVRQDAQGRGHLYGLMGPDEYHEVVDDNAYTNVMARWNLRRAASLAAQLGGDVAEATEWTQLADALVDGWDPERGLYEQFAGYWDLEPLLITDFAEPLVAADVLLGADRVTGSQLIKQADVLMLHHLVPHEVPPGSLDANLAFYAPRTAHGSSLSPAIHAALFARARQPERALELFRLAARLDLDDLTGTTTGGLHVAAMGGVWQALAYGFLGLRPCREHLEIDPCLPAGWDALALRFRLRGDRVAVRADHETVTLSCTRPLSVCVAGTSRRCDPPGASFRLERNAP